MHIYSDYFCLIVHKVWRKNIYTPSFRLLLLASWYVVTSYIHTYYIHTSLSHISDKNKSLCMCANQCEHSINLPKGCARSWLFSITSIILYAHNFWQILISCSYFWTTAQPFPMGNIYLARPSFLVLQRTPCICTFRAPNSSPGRASRHGVTRWVEPQGFYIHIHTAFS